MTIATMGTTDIKGQGEWQLYIYSVAKKYCSTCDK